ncbi:MAG: flavodoxin FldA [Prevotella sp.]|nr:flavodoxin FldA [Prevotella sp.]
MKKTIIVYGSTTGSCQEFAEKIAAKLGVEDVKNVSEIDADTLAAYDNLLLGTSTWGAGELQDDWYDGVETVKAVDLSGKTVALFGCGDAESYPDTFCGGMIEIYNAVKEAGAEPVGQVSTDGYTFDDSEAVQDGQFVGLALDVSEGDDKNDERIDQWTASLQEVL